jgi:hypothetical protein
MKSSPDRGSFSKKKYQEKIAIDPTDKDAIAMLEFYDSMDEHKKMTEQDPKWRKNNLEYDLRMNEYITKKCLKPKYAQNLYAALCNNDFVKNEVWPILKGETWSCSWRYAGGIIADIRVEGDYIDWYCSGIGGGLGNGDEDGSIGYVAEQVVTEEIREDLRSIGWLVVESHDEEIG